MARAGDAGRAVAAVGTVLAGPVKQWLLGLYVKSRAGLGVGERGCKRELPSQGDSSDRRVGRKTAVKRRRSSWDGSSS